MADPDTLPQPADEEQERQERRPKFEPILDQPEPITLGECFWHDKTTWGYNVTHCGVDKVWFVKTAGHADIDGYPAGTPLLVCYRAADPAKPHAKYLEVRQSFIDTPEQPVKKDGLTPTEEKRKIMRDRYIECLSDAIEVARQYNELIQIGEMSTEDIRQIATGLFIERNRKNF